MLRKLVKVVFKAMVLLMALGFMSMLYALIEMKGINPAVVDIEIDES